MILSRNGMRYYLMGLIIVIMAMNIPEVKTLIEDKVKVAQPKALAALKAAYDDVSVAVLPLIGKVIGKPKLLINGKITTVDTKDDFSLHHGQSLTVEQMDAILTEIGSPAVGTGQYWLKYGLESDIDAAYGLAIFYQESGLGTNPNWYEAGRNTGNIICAGYWQCHGNFRDYSQDSNPWASSIKDEMALLRNYRDGGIKDWDAAIMKWAPPSENNTAGYIDNTKTLIRAWRNTNKAIANENGTVINTVVNGIQIPFGDAEAVSAPITVNDSDGFGKNVKAALDANSGALRSVIIEDGQQWSFNATMGSIDESKLATLVHPGDGWCDLACRYIQVLKGLGLKITHGTEVDSGDIVFLQHGGLALHQCTVDESPFIWSAGTKGFDNNLQDVIVNNRTGKTIKMAVIDNGDLTVTVVGKLEGGNILPVQKGEIHEITTHMQDINASFDTFNMEIWGSQGGKHLGTDYALAGDEAVYLPIDSTFLSKGSYPENDNRAGDYVMFRTKDGYELYFGHLKNTINPSADEPIAAGTIIGYGRADKAHTHVQLRTPDGQLADFEKYYAEHK